MHVDGHSGPINTRDASALPDPSHPYYLVVRLKFVETKSENLEDPLIFV